MLYKQLYPTNDWKDINVVMANAEKNFDELKRIDSLQPEGSIQYRYFKVPYADSFIIYQVTKVNTKAGICTIMACTGINLDEWGEGNSIRGIDEVTGYINQRISMEKFLSKTK